MAAPISVSVEVGRPAAVVFDYATDPGRFHEWQKGVVDGHLADPLAVGARCVTTRQIGLAERPVTAEVTHVDPPRTWGVRGVDGPIRARVDLTVEALGAEHSRLTIALDFTGHGIGTALVPLVVRPQARREMPTNLAALKRNLEGPG